MWQPRSVDREQWQPIQHSQLRQHGEFRHVSASERSVITAVWSESSCAFPKNGTATGSRWSARAMATNGETKALISPPPRWVSAWVPAHNHQFVRTPSNPSSLRACLVRTVVARAFINSHRTTSTGNWTRCISPAGQAHRSEWYSGITLTPSRLWLHPPARTYSSKVAGRA